MRYLSLTIAAFFALLTLASAAPPKSPDEAVASFRTLWNESLAKKLETHPTFVLLKRQIFEAGKVVARSQFSKEGLERVTSTLSAEEKKRLIPFGSLDDLNPDRQVWAITHVGDYGSGFEAYMDKENGKLLFLWIIPEG